MRHALLAGLAIWLSGCAAFDSRVDEAYRDFGEAVAEQGAQTQAALKDIKTQQDALRAEWMAGTVASETYFERREELAKAQIEAVKAQVSGTITSALEGGRAVADAAKQMPQDAKEIGYGLLELLLVGGSSVGATVAAVIAKSKAEQKAALLAASQVNAQRDAARIARGEKVGTSA